MSCLYVIVVARLQKLQLLMKIKNLCGFLYCYFPNFMLYDSVGLIQRQFNTFLLMNYASHYVFFYY